MKIRECKKYLNSISLDLKDSPKKNKVKAFLFMVLAGILIICPIVCLICNAFMQYLGIKFAIFSIVICGCILLYLFICVLNVIYLCALNDLNKFNEDLILEEELSFKKLFIAFFTDLFLIISTIVLLVFLLIFINFILF